MRQLCFLLLLCWPAVARHHPPLTEVQADALIQIVNSGLEKMDLSGSLDFSLTPDGRLKAVPILTADGQDKFSSSINNSRLWKHDPPKFCGHALDCYRSRVKERSIHAKKFSDDEGRVYYMVHVDSSYSGRDNIRRSMRHISTVFKNWVLGHDTNYSKMLRKMQRQKQKQQTSNRRQVP